MTTNKLGITISPSSKTNLLNKYCDAINKEIIKKMSACCLCNLVGDNFDIRITSNHQALDHHQKDCHYFYSPHLLYNGWAAGPYEHSTTTNESWQLQSTELATDRCWATDTVSVIQSADWSSVGKKHTQCYIGPQFPYPATEDNPQEWSKIWRLRPYSWWNRGTDACISPWWGW